MDGKKKKDLKTQAFEQDLINLMLKYGFITPSVIPLTLTVSISVESSPVISIVAISADGQK